MYPVSSLMRRSAIIRRNVASTSWERFKASMMPRYWKRKSWCSGVQFPPKSLLDSTKHFSLIRRIRGFSGKAKINPFNFERGRPIARRRRLSVGLSCHFQSLTQALHWPHLRIRSRFTSRPLSMMRTFERLMVKPPLRSSNSLPGFKVKYPQAQAASIWLFSTSRNSRPAR